MTIRQYETVLQASYSVSYTHLDVYKRQGVHHEHGVLRGTAGKAGATADGGAEQPEQSEKPGQFGRRRIIKAIFAWLW